MTFISWFEIPAADFRRATAFYEAIFDTKLILEDAVPGHLKSIFPAPDGKTTGAISWGPDWTPSPDGAVVYLDGGEDLSVVLDRVRAAGGDVVEPKQPIGVNEGFWGRFRDSEGNTVGLLSPQ